MTDPRHALGAAAEDAVAAWLSTAGWRILGRRQRSPVGGEVDLVALDRDGTLVGIEVRARRSVRAGAAAETVGAGRVRRIGRTLASLAAGAHESHAGLRVDLVTVEPIPGAPGRWRLSRTAGLSRRP